jgi:hypothetical protein
MKPVTMDWDLENAHALLVEEDSEDYEYNEEEDDVNDVEFLSCAPRIMTNPRAEDAFFGCLDRGLDGPRALAWRAGLGTRPPMPMERLAYGATLDEDVDVVVEGVVVEEEKRRRGGQQTLPVQGAAWAREDEPVSVSTTTTYSSVTRSRSRSKTKMRTSVMSF